MPLIMTPLTHPSLTLKYWQNRTRHFGPWPLKGAIRWSEKHTRKFPDRGRTDEYAMRQNGVGHQSSHRDLNDTGIMQDAGHSKKPLLHQ
jgi:hypothetical protein